MRLATLSLGLMLCGSGCSALALWGEPYATREFKEAGALKKVWLMVEAVCEDPPPLPDPYWISALPGSR